MSYLKQKRFTYILITLLCTVCIIFTATMTPKNDAPMQLNYKCD